MQTSPVNFLGTQLADDSPQVSQEQAQTMHHKTARRASAVQSKKHHLMGLAEASWSSLTPRMAVLAAGNHSHLGGQRPALLSDVV